MKIGVSIKFLGGVASEKHLTGSCRLITIKRGKRTTRILDDAGLLQNDFKNSVKANRKILEQFDPACIDYIVLTHSHIDHSGRIPLFVKEGFKGRIICAKPTKELSKVMLADSAKIQAQEARYLQRRAQKKDEGKNKHSKKSKNYPCKKDKNGTEHCFSGENQPLYTIEDVENCEQYFKNGGHDYHEPIKLDTGISLMFYPSGHVLGGAIGVISIKKPGTEKEIRIGLSGDIGRKDGIILPPPEIIKDPVNFWVVESTYGGKKHPERKDEIEKLLDIIRSAVKYKMKVILPAFVVERMQEIIWLLTYYMHIGVIPMIPIYLDSPTGELITYVFRNNWGPGLFKDQDKLPLNPFDLRQNLFMQVISDQLESANLSKKTGPYIVIAGAGMCDAGRVRNHLRQELGNSNTIVCLIGYMAEGSLGRKLKDGFPMVKMNDEEIVVRAKIVSFESFSAHADSPFLVEYTENVIVKSKKSKIFIVHGSEKSGTDLKFELIEALGFAPEQIVIPELNEEYVLI